MRTKSYYIHPIINESLPFFQLLNPVDALFEHRIFNLHVLYRVQQRWAVREPSLDLPYGLEDRFAIVRRSEVLRIVHAKGTDLVD